MPKTNRYQNPGRPFHSHPADNLRQFEKEAAPWLELANVIRVARNLHGENWEAHILGDGLIGEPIDTLLTIVEQMERLACEKLTESVWCAEAMRERAKAEAEEGAHHG